MDPINYEDLPGHIQENISAGHILAAHMVETTKGWGLRQEHLTTVQHTSDDIVTGAPVYYCNDICGQECDLDTVRMLMVAMPKTPIASTETPIWNGVHKERFHPLPAEVEPPKPVFFDVGKRRIGQDFMTPDEMRLAEALRAEYFGGLDDDILEQTPLEKLSFLAGTVENFAAEMTDFHLVAEKAFADQERLGALRDWTYERYRISVHNADPQSMKVHLVGLFYIETGLKPGEDRTLFSAFSDHVSDAVLLFDAEKLPEFQPETEPDCGD